ncbi:4-hydroxy-4-methyl-2-oxoglutarate aldolase [Purpureocillium lavendulum]|uniref:4-hydroxy-4-methyl-2-oxoglutarate aldolase n=1 Tax=Purpureocillium lavendulum TaxID=1247861 RepID=A0AB34FG51_9HYPO|nr:4-hydroxy-4-methyl-2-oxoglutarate aldolase [Purpureocillium lavendulum]
MDDASGTANTHFDVTRTPRFTNPVGPAAQSEEVQRAWALTKEEPDPDPGPGPVRGTEPDHDRSESGALPPEPPAEAATVAALKKEKGRVRFNSNAGATNRPQQSPSPHSVPGTPSPEAPDVSLARPRPSVLRHNSSSSVGTVGDLGGDLDLAPDSEKAISAAAAQQRAKLVAARIRQDSASPQHSRKSSVDSRAESATTSDGEHLLGSDERGIPLQTLGYPAPQEEARSEAERQATQALMQDAYQLVQAHAARFAATHQGQSSAATTEAVASSSLQHEVQPHAVPSELNDGSIDGVYNVPPPQQYRGSVLSELLKLYKQPAQLIGQHQHQGQSSSHSRSASAGGQSSGSGGATPNRRKWYEQNRSQETLSNLIEASARLANPNTPDSASTKSKKRPAMHKRTGSASRLSHLWHKEEEARITVHIAETLSRQGYIIKLCRALMLFGAPTHRLEEYLSMTARVLEIDGQFLYLPGCMIISFDDRSTHTTEVRIVRTTQGIDLGKLKDVHHVYKEVMHDVIGADEGTERLNTLMKSKEKFNPWLRVLVFGLTSVTAAPFSFKARVIDLPILFALGCTVGLLQLIVAPKSNLYNNVFEVTATVLVSFLARAFGSIDRGNLFCFSALAQGGIVMLLPGYSSRAIVPGSIRIVYAIIYSLFLGFGITVGAALYGLFDINASSETTCINPTPAHYGFIFVPFFVICISVLYQAKWRQMPTMVVIAFAGYIVNYFSSLKFSASPQIASTLGALTVGVLANLYSRLRHGVAAATLIPAIFTQVPGGLASTGGLLSGIYTANELTKSNQTVNNANGTVSYQPGQPLDSVIFQVAASMIQIAIGIAVGLFMSAFIIYPLGKRRSGLFSF